ncbi:MAG TPA: PrsW family intramembrane metalloprotease [Actinophytocola sp.]|uniref:PrsW family intramembrane metalloprotease n=1 Tax=Actinophytocola sp. TaxID=1872138 RepID=UPI002DB5BB14|nr:PrsW family intramembrane metalloprotease [Actinophytocola sp.]HEU5472736.1 PrsW family intramembrane metalloprotease [Actinophytocola sp.]
MTGQIVLLSIALGLVTNELGEVSPWLARRLVRWSARLRYRHDPERLAIRAEELEDVVGNAPGKLLKLLCAAGFAASAVAHRAHRSVAGLVSRLGRDARRQKFRRRAGLVVLASSGVTLLAISTARVGVVAELVGLGGALLAVVSVVVVFHRVGRWKRGQVGLRWLGFGWGACIATTTALVINNTAEAVGDLLLGKGNGDKVSSIVSAPLFEEAAKGVFVLGILLFVKSKINGVIDGVIYAGFVGAGFAFTENIYYFGRAFAEHGLGDTNTAGLVTSFILRGMLSPFTHPLFTCIVGVGIGLAAMTTKRRATVFGPIYGYLGAVILHAIWNGAATLGNGEFFLNVYFMVMVPIFIAGVWLVARHRKRERTAST